MSSGAENILQTSHHQRSQKKIMYVDEMIGLEKSFDMWPAVWPGNQIFILE
jgi:hypothetical protein